MDRAIIRHGSLISRIRTAEKKHRSFVFDGIGGHRIWDDVKGQSIPGGDFERNNVASLPITWILHFCNTIQQSK